jgi:hypothetical protein
MEIVGAGIAQVHAVSSLRAHGATAADWSWPYHDFIALLRQDGSLCLVNPITQKYNMNDPLQFIQNYRSEYDAECFQNAVVAVQSWLTLRTKCCPTMQC